MGPPLMLGHSHSCHPSCWTIPYVGFQSTKACNRGQREMLAAERIATISEEEMLILVLQVRVCGHLVDAVERSG